MIQLWWSVLSNQFLTKTDKFFFSFYSFKICFRCNDFFFHNFLYYILVASTHIYLHSHAWCNCQLKHARQQGRKCCELCVAALLDKSFVNDTNKHAFGQRNTKTKSTLQMKCPNVQWSKLFDILRYSLWTSVVKFAKKNENKMEGSCTFSFNFFVFFFSGRKFFSDFMIFSLLSFFTCWL